MNKGAVEFERESGTTSSVVRDGMAYVDVHKGVTSDRKMLPGQPAVRELIASMLALVLVVAPLTIGALGTFPVFDDGWNWLYFKERGLNFVPSIPDRPVMGYLWSLLATSEDAYWRISFAGHALLWLALGVISALLWQWIFPALKRYAWVVACVAVAPFGFHVQMVSANIVLGSLLGVVLSYIAFLLLFRFIETGDRIGWMAVAVSLSLLASAIMLIEYSLSVVIVMMILLLWHARRVPDSATKRRVYQIVACSLLVAGIAFAVFTSIEDRTGKMHSPYVRELFKTHFMFPVELVGAVWQGVVGNFAASFGNVQLTSKSGILGVVYGSLVAGLLVYGSRDSKQSSESDLPAIPTSLLLLLAAFVAAVAPAVLIKGMPWNPADGTTARFGIPVLPIAAAILVLLGVGITRRRYWAIPIMIFGMAAGHAAVTEAWQAVRERSEMSALSEALKPHVSLNGGYTVAVLPVQKRKLGPPRQWELTARLTADWPPELRKKFWAHRYGGNPALPYPEEASRVFGSRFNCTVPENLDREIRLIERRGPLDRLLWIERLPNGVIAIEPYCLRS